MRMITAMTGANNMDITWHYPINLIWWYVPPFTTLHVLIPPLTFSPFSLPFSPPFPTTASICSR